MGWPVFYVGKKSNLCSKSRFIWFIHRFVCPVPGFVTTPTSFWTRFSVAAWSWKMACPVRYYGVVMITCSVQRGYPAQHTYHLLRYVSICMCNAPRRRMNHVVAINWVNLRVIGTVDMNETESLMAENLQQFKSQLDSRKWRDES
jgi:hypothetical protein